MTENQDKHFLALWDQLQLYMTFSKTHVQKNNAPFIEHSSKPHF